MSRHDMFLPPCPHKDVFVGKEKQSPHTPHTQGPHTTHSCRDFYLKNHSPHTHRVHIPHTPIQYRDLKKSKSTHPIHTGITWIHSKILGHFSTDDITLVLQKLSTQVIIFNARLYHRKYQRNLKGNCKSGAEVLHSLKTHIDPFIQREV